MGRSGREDAEETCLVEEAVHLLGRKNHSYLKHFGEYANLPHVLNAFAKSG